MKELIFRELYLTRKDRILNLVISLIFLLVGILVMLSMSFGNLSRPTEQLTEENITGIYYICMYGVAFIIMLSSGYNNKLIFSDYAVKWVCFSRTTPIGERKYTGAALAVNIVMSVIGLAGAIGYVSVLSAVSGRTVDSGMLLNLVNAWAVGVCLSELITVLSYYCRTLKMFSAFIAVALLVFYALWMILVAVIAGSPMEEAIFAFVKNAAELYMNNRGILALFSPFVCAVFVLLGWLLSAEIVKRRGI